MTAPAPLPQALRDADDYAPVTALTGTLVDLQRHISHQGNAWMSGVLVCGDGRVRVEVFPTVYATVGGRLTESAVVCVSGRFDLRDTEPKVTVMVVERCGRGSEVAR